MKSLFLGAYWRDRPEDLRSCAVRLHRFLSGIAGTGELLRAWVSLRKAPVQELVAGGSEEEAARLLGAGVNRTDFGGDVIPELGFSADFWNGRKATGQSASLAVTCGLAANNPHLSNSVALNFPSTLTYEEHAALFDVVLEATVGSFEPDWAWIGAEELRDIQAGNTPLFGLLTFLRNDRFTMDVQALEALGAAVHEDDLGCRVRVDPRAISGNIHGLRNAIQAVP